MPTKIFVNHVAILVPSVRKAADYLSQFGFQIGEEEIFEGEGTKEIYVEMGRSNSLLLLETVKKGAYQQALKKRGPGLHHLAIDVLNLDLYLESLSGSGWLLHPKSVKTIARTRTAWLARPGFPGLIEVQERKKLNKGKLFVSKVSLKFDKKLSRLLKSVGLHTIISPSSKNSLVMNGITIKMEKLL